MFQNYQKHIYQKLAIQKHQRFMLIFMLLLILLRATHFNYLIWGNTTRRRRDDQPEPTPTQNNIFKTYSLDNAILEKHFEQSRCLGFGSKVRCGGV